MSINNVRVYISNKWSVPCTFGSGLLAVDNVDLQVWEVEEYIL